MRSKIKTNLDSLAQVFSCFASATSIFFKFWLILWIVLFLCYRSDYFGSGFSPWEDPSKQRSKKQFTHLYCHKHLVKQKLCSGFFKSFDANNTVKEFTTFYTVVMNQHKNKTSRTRYQRILSIKSVFKCMRSRNNHLNQSKND